MLRLHPQTIQSKIIRMTILFTFLIALLIVSICYSAFHTLLTHSMIESTTNNLQLISNSLTSDIEPIINFTNWCSHKNMITHYLSGQTTSNSSQAYATWQQIKEEYLNNASAPYIERIVIGGNGTHYLHISSITSSNAFNMVSTITTLPYFETLYENDDLSWIGLTQNPFSENSEEKSLPIIRPIYSPYNTSKIGWCYLSISPKLFTHVLGRTTSLSQDSKLLLTINTHTYDLQDSNFTEVQLPTASHTYTKNHSVIRSIIDSSGQSHTYVTIPCSIEGWQLTQSLSDSEFTTQRNIYLLLVILIFLIIFALGLGLAVYLDRLINRPLQKVLTKIAAISQGDFSNDLSIEGPNEFGEIGKSINMLSCNVVQLMQKRIEGEKHQKELEYQMLQSQINPHFLYNTLGSIKWMATIQHVNGIAEMTTALSRLMRAISKDTKQLVTLSSEMELLDNYFIIQKYRYGGTITLSYDLEDDSLKSCQLLKFTLEPIVENAIFHGIEPKGMAGHIEIHIYKVTLPIGDGLQIDVTDDGVGMNDDQMRLLLTTESGSQSDFFKKIGIHNVHQRILYNFGPPYGLSLKSELGCYTTVSILLPYQVIKEDTHD